MLRKERRFLPYSLGTLKLRTLFGAYVSPSVYYVQTNKLWIATLPSIDEPTEAYAHLKWVKIADTFDAGYEYVANDDNVFMLTTNCDAPKNKIVKVDITQPGI